MYVDDHTKIIRNPDQEGHTGMTVMVFPMEDDSMPWHEKQKLIDSLVVQCKYSVMFDLMKKDLIAKYAKQKNWDSKWSNKVYSVIKFEQIYHSDFVNAYEEILGSELLKIVADCNTFNEQQVKDHMAIYKTSILEAFEDHIRSICEMN